MSQIYRSLSQMAERGWVGFTVSERSGAQDAKIHATAMDVMVARLVEMREMIRERKQQQQRGLEPVGHGAVR